MVGAPHHSATSLSDVLSEPSQLGLTLVREVHGLEEALLGLRDPMWFVVQHTVGEDNPLEWLGALVNQLVNELTDLTHDAVCVRGRPAVKAARTLFELLVAAKDITTGSWTMADRYDRHRWVIWRDAADLEDRTRRGNLSRQQAHIRKVDRRESDRNAAAAIEDYGSGFRARWHQDTLRDRAESHGLGDDYEWYRLASAVLHGSAGGVLGTYAEFRNGPRLHRTGPAIALASDALAFGLRWARMAFEALHPALGDITQVMTTAIGRIEPLVPRFDKVIRDYDNHLWQSLEPVDLRVFVLVTRWGKPRWYLQAGMAEWVRPALKPKGLTQAQRESLDRIIDQARASLTDDADCASIGMEISDRRVFPEPGKDWQFSPQMFGHPELRWDDPTQPLGIEYVPVDDEMR